MKHYTPEQIAKARAKYEAELRAHHEAYKRGEVELDQSDWSSGFDFVMATYSPVCWQGYFDEEKT